jgi:2',3'-cyclic-nucleotide 2'-phosphodiesterase / 3'-nucleotidase
MLFIELRCLFLQRSNFIQTKIMKLKLLILTTILISSLGSCRNEGQPSLVLLGTTDIHGTFFPYDFVENRESSSSLASVSEYVNQVRKEGLQTILLDNGDILQGQPEVYYYNFVDTVSEHLCASMLNYMKYDAATAGNHDIEAGHQVYDRIMKDYNFPLLAANAVSTVTGDPYFAPYTIIRRNGIKVAVMGLITPSVPNWLPPVLYSGMKFENMTETASKWMSEIEAQNPDVIVGLFHSGWNDEVEAPVPGNSANSVVYNVPGFDIVFTGHDHSSMNKKVVNAIGDTVLVINAGSRASNIARVDIFKAPKGNGNGKSFTFTGSLVKTSEYKPDSGFMAVFSAQYKATSEYVSRIIGVASEEISSRPALFGPSAFVDMIHTIQLDLTGADISFAAPLSFDVSIPKGDLRVADMFKLYRFENMLYKMSMKGSEIDGFLEHSARGWFSTMDSPDDYMLRYRSDESGVPVLSNGRLRLREPVYNFDSAAGIEYVIDLTKEAGNMVQISALSDGRPFYSDSIYTVAINSYRGSGGGGHIRYGAQLSADEALGRLITSTERDLRYYFIEWILEKKNIDPVVFNNWKIIPEKYYQSALMREYPLVYGN